MLLYKSNAVCQKQAGGREKKVFGTPSALYYMELLGSRKSASHSVLHGWGSDMPLNECLGISTAA